MKTDQLHHIDSFIKTKVICLDFRIHHSLINLDIITLQGKFFNFGSKSAATNEIVIEALDSSKASEEVIIIDPFQIYLFIHNFKQIVFMFC